jgi:thiosulfate/3-mercaptopyruvate sulfurtransferase
MTAVLIVVPGSADPAVTPALMSHDTLEQRLARPIGKANLRIIDARPREDYDKGHIPGAVWVDPKATQALAARPGGLTDAAAWEAWIAPLAIGPESEVYVYDANRQLDAARVWWLLRYLGVDKVGLLDGSYPLWAAEKRPISAESANTIARRFDVTFRKDRIATREDALEAVRSGSNQVVDARSRDEYTGTIARSKRGGHVPTACHLVWTELVDEEGRFLEPGVLKSRLAAAGVKPGGVITHCQSGGRASVNAFVLERLGFATRNYYSGWSDWGNAADTPVVVGGDAGARP